MFAQGFDNDKYLKLQSQKIKERISLFGERLYLEFGGKLFDDFHASRVLPGFAPDSKIKMLIELKDEAEIIIAINSADIEKNKVRGDLGITYDLDVLRLIDAFRGYGLYVGSVVMTRYRSTPIADAFKQKLEKLGIKVYKHYAIDGYPHNIPMISPRTDLEKMNMPRLHALSLWLQLPVPDPERWQPVFRRYIMRAKWVENRDMQSLRPSRFGIFR